MASFTVLCYALDSKRPVPYAPVNPVATFAPIAGDVVTYRSMGKVYEGVVDDVGEYFDSPAYLIGKVWVSGGQVIGIVENTQEQAA